MTHETNRYANQWLQDRELPPKSHFRRWTPTCGMEIKVFLGLILAMGLVSLLSIRDYWSMDAVTATPFFPATMARDRFLLLLSFFHLNDNQNFIWRWFPGHDPLYKLGNIFKTIVSRFSSLYYPSKNLSLDEDMVPWKGNLHFRVYNPDKPAKYGIKTCMLCDFDDGYCLLLFLVLLMTLWCLSCMDILEGDMSFIWIATIHHHAFLFMVVGGWGTGTLRKNRLGVTRYIKDIVASSGCVAVASNGPLIIAKWFQNGSVVVNCTD